ncbi:MAG: cell envelope integrity protein TolA [Rhizomicrobium sp.]|jgi:outer membrane biosynthesis protein TonB
MAGEGFLPLGFVGSLVLHGLLLAAMLVTFSQHLDIIDESAPVVPVDLVTLSNKTNVMATVRERPRVAPDVKPVPAPPAPAPAPPQTDDAAPPPEQASSEPLIRKPPPPPVPQVRPQDSKPQKANQNFDSLLALLNKQPAASPRANARVASRTQQGFGAQNAMTADLTTMLQSMIRPCWSPPVGAPNAQDLVVDFDVVLSRDGSVQRVTQLSGQSSSPYFAASAAAARRAIVECAPYKLPADQYDQWQEIDPFHFDPRQMMGD